MRNIVHKNALTDINEVFHSARQGNSEVASLVNSYTEILNPVRVLELFERIPTEVCFNRKYCFNYLFVGSTITSY